MVPTDFIRRRLQKVAATYHMYVYIQIGITIIFILVGTYVMFAYFIQFYLFGRFLPKYQMSSTNKIIL
jgi:hypothetical protein